MIKKIFFFFIMMAGSIYAKAQGAAQTNYDWWNAGVVRIFAKGTVGSGFIVSDQDSRFFIVTAAHVVNGLRKFSIDLAGASYTDDAVIVAQDSLADIAVLSMPDHKMPWKPAPYVINAMTGDHVFCISVRTNREILSGPGGAAVLTAVDDENVFSETQIGAGDSGSALFTEDGIAGCLQKAPGNGKSILFVRDLLNKWHIAWQLPIARIIRNEPVINIPDASKEAEVPITAVYDIDPKKPLPELTDKNLSTSVTYKTEGEHTLMIFPAPGFTYNKLKWYIPEDVNDDTPRGYIYLPDTKKKLSFSAAKLPFMQPDGNGSWIIFDLKGFHRDIYLEIVFKVHKDKDMNPEPFGFYEFQLTGPKQ